MDTNYDRQPGMPAGHQLIEDVREGMLVVDPTGNELGKVEVVKIGDPGAATSDGQTRDRGMVRDAMLADDDPEVPAQLRDSLLRAGYIRVDGGGFLGIGAKRRYVRADRISDVTGDRVMVSVDASRLPEEDRDNALGR